MNLKFTVFSIKTVLWVMFYKVFDTFNVQRLVNATIPWVYLVILTNTLKEFGKLDGSFKWIKGCIILCDETKKTMSDDFGSITSESTTSESTTSGSTTLGSTRFGDQTVSNLNHTKGYIQNCRANKNSFFASLTYFKNFLEVVRK